MKGGRMGCRWRKRDARGQNKVREGETGCGGCNGVWGAKIGGEWAK